MTGYPHYPEWELKAGYSGWTRSEEINGVAVQRLRHYIPRSPKSISRLHMELSFGLRLMFTRLHKPDVVLVVSPALFSCALALLRLRLTPKRPAIGIWVQDLYSRGVVETGTGGSRLGRLAVFLESKILRSADGVVAIHERFKRYMVEALGVRTTAIQVIRNWTHLAASPQPGGSDIRMRLGWSADDVVVLHAGNMGKKQGLENVIHAARLSQQKGSRVRFVLMGDGNQRRDLEALASGASRLQFIKPLPGDEFLEALTASDILLVNELPGVKDMAVPSKLTSYFNAGKPVIAATDAGSVTAVEITASQGGICVAPADPIALLDAAENLGNDPATARSLGENGLRFRNETLSEASALGHYDDFVSSLASSRGR